MNKLLIKHANIYDGKLDSEIIYDYDIYIENGIIKDLGKNLNYTNVKILNLNNCFVVPGLINLHVHLPASGKLSKSKAANQKKLVSFIKRNKLTRYIGLKVCHKNAKTELYSGVTTIRTVGGIANFDSKLRNLINNNKYIGPRILASDEAIGVKNGHMDQTVACAASSIDEAIKMVEQRKENGCDLIKIMVTGGILDGKNKGEIGLLKMDPKMIKAICDKAHSLNMIVAGHIEGEEGVKESIIQGVDTIEHGAKVNDELIKMFKNRNGAYVATFSPAIPLTYLNPTLLGYDEIASYNSSLLLDGMKDFTAKCLQNNIKVGLGTDTGCPLITHYNMYKELIYFTKCVPNITNKFALHTATLVNAQIAQIDNCTGSIEINKSADLLILKDNPLEDLNALKNPLNVIFKGKIFKSKIKRYKKVESLLDTIKL